MLAVSDDLVSQLTQYQAAFSNSLDIAVSLPLVGYQLAELHE